MCCLKMKTGCVSLSLCSSRNNRINLSYKATLLYKENYYHGIWICFFLKYLKIKLYFLTSSSFGATEHFSKCCSDLTCVSLQPLLWMQCSICLFSSRLKYSFFMVLCLIVDREDEFRFTRQRSLLSKWLKT